MWRLPPESAAAGICKREGADAVARPLSFLRFYRQIESIPPVKVAFKPLAAGTPDPGAEGTAPFHSVRAAVPVAKYMYLNWPLGQRLCYEICG